MEKAFWRCLRTWRVSSGKGTHKPNFTWCLDFYLKGAIFRCKLNNDCLQRQRYTLTHSLSTSNTFTTAVRCATHALKAMKFLSYISEAVEVNLSLHLKLYFAPHMLCIMVGHRSHCTVPWKDYESGSKHALILSCKASKVISTTTQNIFLRRSNWCAVKSTIHFCFRASANLQPHWLQFWLFGVPIGW